jgi:hypothetical protein
MVKFTSQDMMKSRDKFWKQEQNLQLNKLNVCQACVHSIRKNYTFQYKTNLMTIFTVHTSPEVYACVSITL